MVKAHPHPFFFFFFNDTATTEIYTLSLHDALPICHRTANRNALSEGLLAERVRPGQLDGRQHGRLPAPLSALLRRNRSEEHTSELQSRLHLVCRLLLEKKKKNLHVLRVEHTKVTNR